MRNHHRTHHLSQEDIFREIISKYRETHSKNSLYSEHFATWIQLYLRVEDKTRFQTHKKATFYCLKSKIQSSDQAQNPAQLLRLKRTFLSLKHFATNSNKLRLQKYDLLQGDLWKVITVISFTGSKYAKLTALLLIANLMTGAKPKDWLNVTEGYDLVSEQSYYADRNGNRFYVINKEDEELTTHFVLGGMLETQQVLSALLNTIEQHKTQWKTAYDSSRRLLNRVHSKLHIETKYTFQTRRSKLEVADLSMLIHARNIIKHPFVLRALKV